MTKLIAGKCDQPDCPFGSDGTCLEGIEDVTACPHFDSEGETDDIDDDDESEESEPPRLIEDLPTGENLTLASCNIVTYSTRARVVAIAGHADSGKTTLLAAIYEKFQNGTFAGYSFAGSHTLPGFERRCFLSRLKSGNQHPDTERSKGVFGQTLLHLRVRSMNGHQQLRDLLFTDLAGEDFRQATNSTEFCKRLEIVRRADHFVLLIDGDRLSGSTDRQIAIADARMLLRRFLDAGMLGSQSHVYLVFTKHDKWIELTADSQFEEWYEAATSSFVTEYSNKVASLHVMNIAARAIPKSNIANVAATVDAFNLDKLFPLWVERMRTQNTHRVDRRPSATRSYDRYS